MRVEKGVPIPKVSKNRLYPFHGMEVGDSFLFEFEHFRQVKSLRSAVYRFSQRHGKKFTVRRESDAAYRCWRTE